jgi:hypothetical protein
VQQLTHKNLGTAAKMTPKNRSWMGTAIFVKAVEMFSKAVAILAKVAAVVVKAATRLLQL